MFIFSWVDLMVPLGTLILNLLILFHIFGFIVTQALIYICFAIGTMIDNCPENVSILALVINKTVLELHFSYWVVYR